MIKDVLIYIFLSEPPKTLNWSEILKHFWSYVGNPHDFIWSSFIVFFFKAQIWLFLFCMIFFFLLCCPFLFTIHLLFLLILLLFLFFFKSRPDALTSCVVFQPHAQKRDLGLTWGSRWLDGAEWTRPSVWM